MRWHKMPPDNHGFNGIGHLSAPHRAGTIVRTFDFRSCRATLNWLVDERQPEFHSGDTGRAGCLSRTGAVPVVSLRVPQNRRARAVGLVFVEPRPQRTCRERTPGPAEIDVPDRMRFTGGAVFAGSRA